MLPTYIEDLFVNFYDHVMMTGIQLQGQDVNACDSFYYTLINNKELTQNQANFVLKLLHKYKSQSANTGLDYSLLLANPQWKNSFRVLDMSRKLWVEETDQGLILCLKFPYQLKADFEKRIPQHNVWGASSWDAEKKIRTLSLYEYNPLPVYDFAKDHNFEIDDSFYTILSQVEEVWQNQENIIPQALVLDNKVLLVNSSEETDQWFDEHRTGVVSDDLMLAKSMGYYYKGPVTNKLEQIAATKSNSFWIKYNEDFLSLTKRTSGKICIVLDRTCDEEVWVREFAKSVDRVGIDRKSVRVCFRKSKEEDNDFNQWVNENGFGGKVEDGKIYIFSHKPAKWLFKDSNPATILVTNNLYPATNMIAKDWFNSHPCVVYLGDIKPSELKDQDIVEL